MAYSSTLFSPLLLAGLTFPNRIVVSPMCEYSSEDGFANDWHLVHLGSRAVGGAGLVFTEASAVTPEGRISPQDLGFWKDEHIPGLKRIVDFIHIQGARAGIQLAHAGRKASMSRPWDGDERVKPLSEGGWQAEVLAPSAVPFSERYAQPTALDATGIKRLVEAFLARRLNAPSRRASTSSSSMPPTATSCTSSCRRSAISAAMNTAAASKTGRVC